MTLKVVENKLKVNKTNFGTKNNKKRKTISKKGKTKEKRHMGNKSGKKRNYEK